MLPEKSPYLGQSRQGKGGHPQRSSAVRIFSGAVVDDGAGCLGGGYGKQMAIEAKTRYAKSGDISIAYRVLGEGPSDLVLVPGWISHVEFMGELPQARHFLERLTSFARLIVFDKRGTGLSDRVADLPTLEQRMDDVRAVMEAADSERSAVLGVSEGAPMSLLFAATYPDRVSSLVLYGGMAKSVADEDYPWAPPADLVEASISGIDDYWGEGAFLEVWAPSVAEDERIKKWWSQFERLGASPGAMVQLMKMFAGIDVRHVLPVISVPTLVLHRKGDRVVNYRGARWMAEQIPGAKYVELQGVDHVPIFGDTDSLIDEIEEFLTGVRPALIPDRVLATVLFTDIVGSTERAAEMGDAKWRGLLEEHDLLVRRELERFRGREVKTTGDGFLATFDGPARAIRCAASTGKALGEIGIEIRAGLHTGECEILASDVGGIAVHIAARVSALAHAGEVLVSSTVKDLVAGSGISFEDRGSQVLKGVPDEWRVFAVNPLPV